jgi:isoleucyl-tRNA synthetase
VDPWDVIKADGADAFRWYLYTATPPGNERRFSVDLVGEVIRSFTLTLWNVYSFFVTYANLDRPDLAMGSRAEHNILDRWVLSELNVLVRDVTAAYERYDVTERRGNQAFVDRLSTWYLRRSRRRFWKSNQTPTSSQPCHPVRGAGHDRATSRAACRSYPEQLYQIWSLRSKRLPRSVHLSAGPPTRTLIDEALNRDMALVQAGIAGPCGSAESQPQGASTAARGRVFCRYAVGTTRRGGLLRPHPGRT